MRATEVSLQPLLIPNLPDAVLESRRGTASARKFVMLGGAMALAYAADYLATRRLWKGEPEIIANEPASAGEILPERWLVMPGHGQHDPRPLTQVLQDNGVAEAKALSGFRYSQKGFSVERIGSKVVELSRTAERLSVFGNSMGSVTFFEAVRRLPEEERASLPPLGRVVLNSSPFDIYDARDARLAKFITAAHFPASLSGKMMLGTVDRWRNSQVSIKELAGGVVESSRVTLDPLSPRTWMQQTRFLVSTAQRNLLRDIDSLAGIVTHKTQAIFCLPDREDADKTIKDRQAYAKWSEFFGHFGVDLQLLYLENAEHADIVRASQQLGPWLKKTANTQL